MPDDELYLTIQQFKRGDFTKRKRFITCYTRLAASAGLQYGLYKDVDESFHHRAEDLVDTALLELSMFPDYVAEGKLEDNNIKRYLLSRIHYACKNYLRSNKILGWSKTHLKNKGISQLTRETFHYTDGSIREEIRDKAYQYEENTFVRDMMECVQTELERIIMSMYFQNYTNLEIAYELGWRSSTRVKLIIDIIVNRYKETLLD